MELTPEQSFKWSRYGMDPYNWILDGKLMASVYPKMYDYLEFLRTNEKIRTALNLTENPWPDDWSERSGIVCYDFPVIDMSVPTEDQVRKMIQVIDNSEGPVMVHCAAGIGRTGTLIALYLVNHGMKPLEAIRTVRKKRIGSIQTSAQEGLIFDWARTNGDDDD
jgi:atypical dual specificity phosphatase